MPRILIISDITGGPGGVYTYLGQIDNFLSTKLSITILLEVTTYQSLKDIYKFRTIEFVPLSTKFHETPVILNALAKSILRIKPDLVHIINGSIKSNLLIREHLSAAQIPFIVTEQYVDDGVVLDSAVLQRVIEVNSKSAMTIFVSDSNARIAKTFYHLAQERCKIIYNAVEPLRSKKRIYSDNPFRILTIGRCAPEKGIEVIIRAISSLITPSIKFTVLGDGPLKNTYLTLAESYFKNGHSLEIQGWQNSIDYSLIADQYDLYISASYQEGFSYSVLETATAGLPLIASNCSGNVELFQLCNYGQLFDRGNDVQLAQLLQAYFRKPDAMHENAIRNRTLVDYVFDINKMILLLEEIYRQYCN